MTLVIFALVASLSAESRFDRLAEQFNGDTVKTYNPAGTMALSLVPGGGQLYTHHFTRGGLFLGTELLMAGQVYTRWQWYKNADTTYQEQKRYYDSISREMRRDTVLRDSVKLLSALNERQLRAYDVDRNRIDYLNWSAWAGGIYLWNLVDGLGCSNRFDGVDNPTPRRAALLSAIPFTGAGQFYNGSFFKGALVSTVQLGCLFSAYNFGRAMDLAEKYENDLTSLPDSAYYKIPDSERSSWRGRYDAASRQRTMFMWYGVIFYLYGIADASVDAYLHDFNSHFRITGNVDPKTSSVSMGISGDIPAKK